MRIIESEAKSIIVPSKIPDTDFVVNPYTGCQFACLYCYATFMCRFVNEARDEWGNFVYVKTNAVELARRQLRRWPAERSDASVFFSSVTDPYQGIERKYRLTRSILEEFFRAGYTGSVSILTKSPLVLRDIDLLRQLNAEVGLTITTTDDHLSHFMEVRAPLASRRLDTLARLAAAGVSTYAFVGPLLPHFRYQPERLDELFRRIAATGTRELYVEHMNLSAYIRGRMWEVLRKETPEIQSIYRNAGTSEHRDCLDRIVKQICEQYGLKVRLGGTILHSNQHG